MGLRHGLSYNVIANMINSVLIDLGFEDASDFISPQKVGRMAKKHYLNLDKDHMKTTGYECIGYDGKKSDLNLPKNQVQKLADKLTITCMQRHTYIGHKCPANGKGCTLASCIYEV